MGGGSLLNAAVNTVKQTLTLDHSQASRIGLVPDTLACIYPRITRRTTLEAAYNALEWYNSLLNRFAFLAVPGEGLAKAGKETRGSKPERQVLTPVVPLVGPASYQGVRAAEQVLVEAHSRKLVGSEKIPKFDVFKAIGDADSGQAYLAASFEARGLKCFDPFNLPTSQLECYQLLYDTEEEEQLSFSDWRSLLRLLSNPKLDLSRESPSNLPLFVPPSASPVSTTPSQLSFLPLTRDRDAIWSDTPYLALSIHPLPNSILLEYVNCQEVWREAGREALALYKKHRDARLRSIRQDANRRNEAKKHRTSYDGRFLLSSSETPSIDDAVLGVAFATAQTGDFGGLKPGSSVGIKTFLYLFLACEGDLEKVWETLYYHDVDTLYVRGRRSFYLPLIRQSIVFAVPSKPSDLAKEKRQPDGSSNLESEVYGFKNRVAATIRRRAIEKLYPELRLSFPSLPQSPTEDDLDSPQILMAALHFLGIVPRAGFKYEASTSSEQPSAGANPVDPSTSSPLSRRSTLPSYPSNSVSPPSTEHHTDDSSESSPSSHSNVVTSYTTGLLDTKIKPPLRASLWDEKDYEVEGTGEYRYKLSSNVSKSFDAGSKPFELQSFDADDRLGSRIDELDDDEDDTEPEESESEESESEDETEGEGEGGEDKEEPKSYFPWAATRKVIFEQLQRERIDRLAELLTQKIPTFRLNRELLVKLSRNHLRSSLQFFEDERTQKAFIVQQGELLLHRPSYIEITSSFQNPGNIQAGVLKLLALLDIGLTNPLVQRLEAILDAGGLESPAVNRRTVLPLLFLRRHVNQVNDPGVLRFVYLTNLLGDKWTSESPAPIKFIENALCNKVSPDSTIYCKDRLELSRALIQIRLIAGIFGLAPPTSLREKPSDLPDLTEDQIESHLGSFLRCTSDSRHSVSLSQLRQKIRKVGGPNHYGNEVGTLKAHIGMDAELRQRQHEMICLCWKWIETLVEETVGEEGFEKIFGPRIDWKESEDKGYIISRKI